MPSEPGHANHYTTTPLYDNIMKVTSAGFCWQAARVNSVDLHIESKKEMQIYITVYSVHKYEGCVHSALYRGVTYIQCTGGKVYSQSLPLLPSDKKNALK